MEAKNMDKLHLWAEKLKAMGHPVRLEILLDLYHGSYDLKRIMEKYRVSQPAVSQHLSIMRRLGMIRCSREGVSMCYAILDDDVRQFISLLTKEVSQ
ncbi:winged helix-turn-helix transcriptional regulator [Candidatus Mcinerneyibacteriota bacterium]|nr:winged helix-turn-helix transcriptional regulator [Candidatus Mcinerneyibacteriota bacterium]